MEINHDEIEKLSAAFLSEERSVNFNDCYGTSENHVPNKSKPRNAFKYRTCSYFYKYGYCKFGSNCKYKHLKNVNNKNVSKQKSAVMNEDACNNSEVENKNLSQNYISQSPKQEMIEENFIEGDSYVSEQAVDLCCNEISSLNLSSSPKIRSKIFSASKRLSNKRTKPLCYYFKKGLCYKGDSCKYYHPQKNNFKTSVEQVPVIYSENKDCSFLSPSKFENSNFINKFTTKRPVSVFNKPLNIHDLTSLTIETVSELRSNEINQLKKRFPHFETVKENETFSIMFQPSDPDWPFDLKSLKLEVNFPVKYPTEKCKISVIQNIENIPLLLIKFLNTAICEWVDKKFEENSASNKVELIFRTFLKWFDKNLEELFIAGLKKVKQDHKAKEDGIEFVPVENLFSATKHDVAEELKETEENDLISDSLSLQEQTLVSDDKNVHSSSDQSNKLPYYGGNNGMKIIFSELELTEGAAAFICTKLSITLQCSRCKTSFNMKSVPKKNNSHVCSKCSKNVGFTFDPATVHQFSSVLGSVHLLDCVAVDINLVECHFLVDCLKCSKQIAVDGIHYGQKHKMWCIFCNEKMLISIGSVKFQALKLVSIPDAKYLPVKRIEKKVKDPVVKEGEPLPNFGACKHYKKSFRWLRFPCCGRLYPCDECHNEKETDHEMKYASRMICGFCAKEQPYSREKPCLSCTQSMTKKSGSHWEGGRGCRNKIQMSREDKQKYSGSCKTVSRKAQNTKPKKKH